MMLSACIAGELAVFFYALFYYLQHTNARNYGLLWKVSAINSMLWVEHDLHYPVCLIDMLRVRDFIEIGKKFSHISLGFLLICPTVYLVATRDV